MPDTADRNAPTGGGDVCLDISLQPVASHIRASDGREIPFTRAMLTIRNVCNAALENVRTPRHAWTGRRNSPGCHEFIISFGTFFNPPQRDGQLGRL